MTVVLIEIFLILRCCVRYYTMVHIDIYVKKRIKVQKVEKPFSYSYQVNTKLLDILLWVTLPYYIGYRLYSDDHILEL